MSIGGQDAHLVIGDGTNQTAQLRTALVAARDSATIKTVRVLGTVLIDPTFDETGDANGVVLYQGCTLEGVGHSSVIRARPDGLADLRDYYFVRYHGDTTVRNLRFDGNKTAINSAGWEDHGQIVLVGAFGANASDTTFENLWIHDVLSVNSESFGILTLAGESNVRIHGCRAWGIDGTGISANALPLVPPPTTNVDIADCSCWNNGWQGFSIHGCDDVRVADCHAWGNTLAGFNFEWSDRIDIFDGVAHDNGLAGIATIGDVNLRVNHCVLYNNNGGGVGNEVMLFGGTSGRTRCVAGRIELRDCVVRPPAGRSHVWYSVDEAVTAGRSVPDIVLVGADVVDWKVQNSDAAGRWHPGVTIAEIPDTRPVYLGTLSGWTGTATIAAYIGSDAVGANPVTISASSQYQERQSWWVLHPRRRYRVRVRIKAPAVGQPWFLDFVNTSFAPVGQQVDLPNGSTDAGQWFTFDTLIAVGANQLAIRFINHHAGASSLVVDYVAVTEITAGPAGSEQSSEASVWNGAHPVLGGYHLWIDSGGRLRLKGGQPTSDVDGVPVGFGDGSIALLHPNMPASAPATNLAAGAFVPVSDPNLRVMADLRGRISVRIQGRIGGTLAATTKIRVQYHLGGDPNVASGDAGWGTLATSAGLHGGNVMFYASEVSVPAAARVKDVLLRAGLADGDGVADPTITCCVLLFS